MPVVDRHNKLVSGDFLKYVLKYNCMTVTKIVSSTQNTFLIRIVFSTLTNSGTFDVAESLNNKQKVFLDKAFYKEC